MSSKKNQDPIVIAKRKATVYIKENAFKICSKLNNQPKWTVSQLKRRFKEGPQFIQKMVSMGLLGITHEAEEFDFTAIEKDNLLICFNRKKIIDWSLKYDEEKLINLDGYRDFIYLTYQENYWYQSRFFDSLITHSLNLLDKISYWEVIDSINGQIQFYLLGKEYFEEYDYVQRRKYIEKYFTEVFLKSFDEKIVRIENRIKKYEYLTQYDKYKKFCRSYPLALNINHIINPG